MQDQGFSESSRRLVHYLSRLPGIGEKTAVRLAYYILRQDPDFARQLGTAIQDARERVKLCESCFGFTEETVCELCLDIRRDPTILCVVERPMDIFSVERSGQFKGRFHVLHGVLSPLDGVGVEDLKIRELLERIRTQESGESHVTEVIFALNPSLEGETTTLYLVKLLQNLGVRVSQLASGIPVGGMIEYSDRHTLGRAFANRMELKA